MKVLGHWWADKDIEVVEIKGKAVALWEFNGEVYASSFYVSDEINGCFFDAGIDICVKPVYQETGEGEFENIDYEICV